MPRTSVAKRLKELKTSGPIIPGASRPPPRLWNAHKRIKTGKTQPLPGRLPQKLEEDEKWREIVTPDIVEYIDKAKPSLEDCHQILRNSHKFFSRPRNVPVEFRQQVYLYDQQSFDIHYIQLLIDTQSQVYSYTLSHSSSAAKVRILRRPFMVQQTGSEVLPLIRLQCESAPHPKYSRTTESRTRATGRPWRVKCRLRPLTAAAKPEEDDS